MSDMTVNIHSAETVAFNMVSSEINVLHNIHIFYLKENL